MRSAPRPALAAAAVLSFLTVLGPEPALKRDVAAARGDLRWTIGAVRLPLFSTAWAQGTAAVTLENVTLAFGPTTYTIPRISFTGVSLPEADLRALFEGGLSDAVTALERLNAREVSIPEVTAEVRVGKAATKQVFKGVTAHDIERGRVARFSAAGSTTETKGPGVSSTAVEEGLAGTDLDLAAYARIFAQKRGAQPEPPTRVLGAYSVERSSLRDEQGVTVRSGPMRVRDLAIAPIEESWSTAVSLIMSLAEVDQPSEQDLKRVLLLMADAFESSAVGSIEANDLDMSFPGPSGPALVSVKRIGYGGAGQGRPSEVRLDGLELRAPEGRMQLKSWSLAGFSLEPTIKGLRGLKDKPFEDFDHRDARSLIPVLGTLRYEGLSLDFQAPGENGKAGERLEASIGEMALTADKPLNGIPTNVRLSVRNLAFALPSDGDEALRTVRELGYKDVDISYALSATWNEAQNEIVLSDVSFAGVDIGQITLKGVLGGATRELFDPDPAVAMGAALAATARSAELTVENGGIFERHLRHQAQKRKKTPDAVRAEYAAAAALLIPGILGNSPQAKTLGDAVARFLANPTRLQITARSIDPNGLGLADVAGTAAPAALIEKLDISTAAGERR